MCTSDNNAVVFLDLLAHVNEQADSLRLFRIGWRVLKVILRESLCAHWWGSALAYILTNGTSHTPEGSSLLRSLFSHPTSSIYWKLMLDGDTWAHPQDSSPVCTCEVHQGFKLDEDGAVGRKERWFKSNFLACFKMSLFLQFVGSCAHISACIVTEIHAFDICKGGKW